MRLEQEPQKERILRYRKIGVDFDGVVTLSEVPVLAELNRRFKETGAKFTRKDITEWEWIVKTRKLRHLPEEERQSLNQEIWNNPEVLLAAPPRPGALATLKKLNNLGANLNFVTSREPHLWEVTHEWFSRWLPWVRSEQIYIRDEKKDSFSGILLSGRMFKAFVTQGLALEVFIEDDPEAAELLATHTQVLLMKHKINKAFRKKNESPSITVVDGWSKVYRHLLV